MEDNGIGFLQPPASSPGMGLQTMRYRAKAIGAALAVRSVKDKGTLVTCKAVFPDKTANALNNGTETIA